MMTTLPTTLAEAEALEFARQFVAELQEDKDNILAAVLGMSLLDSRAGRRLACEALKSCAMRYGWQGMALVVDLARAGVVDAQQACEELHKDYLHAVKPIPPTLADYIIRPRPAAKRARSKTTNYLLDLAMAALVEQIINRFHLKPTRNKALRDLPYKLSACAVVWLVFTEAGLHRGSERAVEQVWRRYGAMLMAAPELDDPGRNVRN
jgi:hypothetical protein